MRRRDFLGGLIVAAAVGAGLIWAILRTSSLTTPAPAIDPLTVKRIGEALMTELGSPVMSALRRHGLLLGLLRVVFADYPRGEAAGPSH